MYFIKKLTISKTYTQSIHLVGLVATLCVVGFLLTSCIKTPSSWQTDYETAISLAQKDDKNIFLIFTGLELDTVSAELKTNIFDTVAFKKDIGKDYILLNIDIKKNDGPIPDKSIIKQYELALSMGVEALPTVLLITQGGHPFATISMSTKTKLPSDLIALVDAKKSIARKITSLYKRIENTEGINRVKAIDAYINSIPEQFLSTASSLFTEVLNLDTNNTTGLLGKYKLLLAHEKAARAHAIGDIDTSLNSFLVLVDEPELLTPLEKQNAYYMTAYYSYQSGTVPKEELILYLQQAYNAAPDSDNVPHFLTLIEELGDSE